MMTAQCDTSTRPYVTWLLSVAMVVTYGWIVLTSQNDPFSILKIYDAYALYPNRLNWMEPAMTSLSALFIHATWSHLVVNLVVFLITAPSLERYVGPIVFGLFYGVCGMVGNLAEITIDPIIGVPVVGASTAIAGIAGAVVVLRARPKTQQNLTNNRAFFVAVVTCFWIVVPLPDWAKFVSTQADIAQVGHTSGMIAGMIAAILYRQKFS
jgi:membrane associated rhomboid family serine protease